MQARLEVMLWYKPLCFSLVNVKNLALKTNWFTQQKQWDLYQRKVTSILFHGEHSLEGGVTSIQYQVANGLQKNSQRFFEAQLTQDRGSLALNSEQVMESQEGKLCGEV